MEKTLRLSAEQRDDLVAYLDGELPDTKAQDIDKVLARSEVARHEVEALARTWEMLDVLPTPKAPPEFTERTMTTLKVAEVPFDITEQPWFAYLKRAAVAAVWIVVLGVSGLLGYQVTNEWIENPSKQMLTDLPTLQNLDLYQEVESFDFLDKLQKNKVFDEATDKAGSAGAATRSAIVAGRKSLVERHDQVVKMSQVERDRLQRNLTSFQKLPADKQAQYRELNNQLDENKQTGGHLAGLLDTYSAWLHTLTPSQRDELKAATESNRKIALVQKFKEQQFKSLEEFATSLPEMEPVGPRFMKPLSMSELTTIMNILVTDLPAADQEKIGKVHRPDQFAEVLRLSIQQAESPRSWPSTAVIAGIVDALPHQTRNLIRKNSPNQRKSVLTLIFWSIVFHASDEARSRMPKEEDLKQILNNMDPNQRARLEQRPPEEMRRELTRRYFMARNDSTFDHLQELRLSMGRLMEEIGLPPPPPPPRGPNGRGPDGRGPGPEGRGPGPEGRGPEGRGPEFGPGPGPGDRPRRDGPRPLDRPRPDGKDGNRKPDE